MDDLLAEFIAETREMLEAVQEELVAWEADPADRAKLDGIFRFVHTVKGNCGFFDLPRLAALSHAAESALADVRGGKRQTDAKLVDAIFAVIDRIGEMVDTLEAGGEIPAGSDADLIAAFDANTVSGPAAETAPAKPENEDKKAEAVPAARSIRLPVNLLDRVMAGISDIVLVRNELGRHLREAEVAAQIGSTFDRLSGIIENLREDISQMRMHRLDHLYGPLPRLVRDLSAELGKKVSLEVEGGQVELDREVIELVRDPIVHILRNAIDHGIEMPDARKKAGKAETGSIEIFTRQTGNRISIAIVDDGAGIDTDRLGKKAVDAGIATAEEVQAMSQAAKLELIFEPGISTAAKVTSVSGRGVGMDVVRANIERLGGEISVTSELGEGTRLFVSLPATLSIVPSLTVQVGDHRFGVPRSYVEEIVSSRSEKLEFSTAGASRLVEYRGEKLRCCSLAGALEIDGEQGRDTDLLIIKIASGDLFALVVDQVLSHEDLVVKPLADVVMQSNLYTGASLLDDGSLVLMLHIAGISIQQGLLSDIIKKRRVFEDEATQQEAERPKIPAVLFATLDGRQRLVRMDSVNRITKVPSDAFRLDAADPQFVLNDVIVPLCGANHGELPEGQANVLLLGDGETEIGYLIDRVLDTVALDGTVMTDKASGEVEGVALLDGRAVEMLDCHWLFAQSGRPSESAQKATCRIDLSDQWARAILHPLVEAAGYRVIDVDAEEDADIAIALDEASQDSLRAAQVIQLQSDREAPTDGERNVYRYDREALVNALKSGRRTVA
ncbi:chemotaxis protein CheA [Aurantiacibacter gangjinensis]|uniref:Chemotaxis protein CheA n=1 Tax=Aurantiacibacter gangjinensis TaxID=502682 RepID=A0A0G9ML76_9SPHN|nr:chemotaxis protein CheW [Aurantiacibacter gangjinensis]APE27404.1 Signal transduction histidine kinase CheA [Aurantiacibacter gangjinensis]KLE31481.1 hypothetical protein AAW01_07850 [Aurantiacibacter gangjinensis]